MRRGGDLLNAPLPLPLRRKKPRVLRSASDYVLEAVCVLLVTLFALVCVLPFIYVLCVSFMSYEEYLAHPLRVIPQTIDFTAYKKVLDYALIRSAYGVSAAVTVGGTVLSVFLLIISAYPLSKKSLAGRRALMSLILFTMFFNGGMIPNYILIRTLKLNNTLGALVLPICISSFQLILMKNFIIQSVPESLEEAAKIDGANDLYILFRVVVPLLKPAIATMVVFSAVEYWNSYYAAMMYITSRKLWPLTLVLRELVIDSTGDLSPVAQMLTSEARAHPFTLKMAAIIITVLPIMVIYPFMQKHFVKGISLGSVKE
jgi:putative aldouronate transport system permease protein